MRFIFCKHPISDFSVLPSRARVRADCFVGTDARAPRGAGGRARVACINVKFVNYLSMVCVVI